MSNRTLRDAALVGEADHDVCRRGQISCTGAAVVDAPAERAAIERAARAFHVNLKPRRPRSRTTRWSPLTLRFRPLDALEMHVGDDSGCLGLARRREGLRAGSRRTAGCVAGRVGHAECRLGRIGAGSASSDSQAKPSARFRIEGARVRLPPIGCAKGGSRGQAPREARRDSVFMCSPDKRDAADINAPAPEGVKNSEARTRQQPDLSADDRDKTLV